VLQMIERVLASLIILGMLVIVMFLAFNKNGRDLVRTENEPAVETPAERGVETQTKRTVETQTQQPTEQKTVEAEKPEPQMQAERTPAVVPNPGTPAPKKTPAPAEKKTETAKAPEKTSLPKSAQKRVKPKVVEKTQARLRESTVADAKPAKRENATRIERTPPMAYNDDRDDERPHRYLRRADYRRAWRRTDDYECADGRCDCSCEPRYYWARTPPECWDW
jgi:outer membrane biosynthesis protein TonB